jgi:hypothetical protein
MASEMLCALLAAWVLEAWIQPEKFARHIGGILRTIREETNHERE